MWEGRAGSAWPPDCHPPYPNWSPRHRAAAAMTSKNNGKMICGKKCGLQLTHTHICIHTRMHAHKADKLGHKSRGLRSQREQVEWAFAAAPTGRRGKAIPLPRFSLTAKTLGSWEEKEEEMSLRATAFSITAAREAFHSCLQLGQPRMKHEEKQFPREDGVMVCTGAMGWTEWAGGDKNHHCVHPSESPHSGCSSEDHGTCGPVSTMPSPNCGGSKPLSS